MHLEFSLDETDFCLLPVKLLFVFVLILYLYFLFIIFSKFSLSACVCFNFMFIFSIFVFKFSCVYLCVRCKRSLQKCFIKCYIITLYRIDFDHLNAFFLNLKKIYKKSVCIICICFWMQHLQLQPINKN